MIAIEKPKKHYLLMESTYGDRKHVNLADMDQKLSELIQTTIARGRAESQQLYTRFKARL